MDYKNKLLKLCGPQVNKVNVAGQKEPLYVRSLTVAELIHIETVASESKDDGERAFVTGVMFAWCDKDGKQVFSYPEDYDAVSKLDGKLLMALSAAASKASGLGKGDIGNAEKN